MPELGERLGELHDEAVQLVVVAVAVLGEELRGDRVDARARGDELHGQHVDLAGLARAHEVGEAQVPVAALPGEAESQTIGAEQAAGAAVGREQPRMAQHALRIVAVVQDHDVVALGDDGEEAVRDRGVEHALAEDAVEPVPEPRPPLALDQLLVARAALAASGLQAPLAEEGRPLVEERGVVGERDAAHDAGAPERRGGHGIVARDVGARGHRLGLGERQPRSGGVDALLQRRQPHLGGVGAAGDAHERLHQGEPLEGVAGVADLAVEEAGEVVLDVGAGEGRPAEDDGPALRETSGVQLFEVLLHHDRGLHEQPGHADDVGVVLLGGGDDVRDGLLDAEVDHLVAVVRQDDVDEVLADVVHVAAHGGEDDAALARGIRLLHVRFEQGDRVLHDLGGLQHEGQLHLARAEALADDLHALEQVVVDDAERRHAVGERELEVGFEPLALAVDDAAFEAFADGQRGELGGALVAERGGVDAGEEVEHAGERVVGDVALGVEGAAVPDEVEGDFALLGRERGERHDLRGVDDAGVEARFDRFVQEDGVEYAARGRVQPEGDVGDAEGEVQPRVRLVQAADRLDRLDRVAPGLLLTGRDREGERIEHDVVLVQPPLPRELLDEAGGDAHLVVGGARLPLLVDGEGDDGGAVLLHERHDAAEAGGGAVAVLVVDRVHHGATADELQAGGDHGGLGGVDDERQGRGAREPGDDLADVGDAVAADVVDADVEEVGADAGLLLRDLDAILVAALEHGLTEGLRAVRVGALADRQVRGVLVEGDVLVERGDPRLDARATGCLADDRRRGIRCGGGARRGVGAEPLDHRREVLGRRAAAAADEGEAELAHELLVRRRELGRRERVVRAVGAEHRQAGVRHAGDRHGRVLGEVAEVLAHLGRAGGAVQADRVDAEGFEGGERGADLGAHEHGAGGLDGHLDEDRQADAAGDDRLLAAVHRGLRLQQVLRGLDEEGVGPAVDEAFGLQGERLLEVLVRGVAEARQLRAGAHRAEHPAEAPVGALGGLDALAGDAGPGLGELGDAVVDAVVGEVRPVRTEGVRLDGVDADGEIGVVDAADDVGAGRVQDLVAPLVALEVDVEGELVLLQHGAHRAVGDHDPRAQRVEQRLGAHRAGHRLDIEGETRRSRARGGGQAGHAGESNRTVRRRARMRRRAAPALGCRSERRWYPGTTPPPPSGGCGISKHDIS